MGTDVSLQPLEIKLREDVEHDGKAEKYFQIILSESFQKMLLLGDCTYVDTVTVDCLSDCMKMFDKLYTFNEKC